MIFAPPAIRLLLTNFFGRFRVLFQLSETGLNFFEEKSVGWRDTYPEASGFGASNPRLFEEITENRGGRRPRMSAAGAPASLVTA
jgi:hypothetical protein